MSKHFVDVNILLNVKLIAISCSISAVLNFGGFVDSLENPWTPCSEKCALPHMPISMQIERYKVTLNLPCGPWKTV